MTDRLLTVEFPALLLEANAGKFRQFNNQSNDWTPLITSVYDFQYWKTESKLDLSGYAMQDLTTFFRRSFEQRGGITTVNYQIPAATGPAASAQGTINLVDVATYEVIIISSVPFTDTQLASIALECPGFTHSHIYSGLSSVDFGNFNRNHIIHGHFMANAPDETFGSGPTTNSDTTGNLRTSSFVKPIDDLYFSSLEATSADCLYCYRLLFAPAAIADDNTAGLYQINLPPMRVMLDSSTAKEQDLEYLMRLKRSYELANQV